LHVFSCINVTRLQNTTLHKQQQRTSDSTNPVQTSMDMQPRSLPTRRYTSMRCYITNPYIGKSVHSLLRQTTYMSTSHLIVAFVSYRILITTLQQKSRSRAQYFCFAYERPWLHFFFFSQTELPVALPSLYRQCRDRIAIYHGSFTSLCFTVLRSLNILSLYAL